MWELAAGLGVSGLCAVIWALWERSRRARAEGKVRLLEMDNGLKTNALERLSLEKRDQGLRHENVISYLKRRLKESDEACRPVAGDEYERLRSMLSPTPTKTGAAPGVPEGPADRESGDSGGGQK